MVNNNSLYHIFLIPSFVETLCPVLLQSGALEVEAKRASLNNGSFSADTAKSAPVHRRNSAFHMVLTSSANIFEVRSLTGDVL